MGHAFKNLLIICLFTVALSSYGQSISLQIIVTDSVKNPVSDAYITLTNKQGTIFTFETNAYGTLTTQVQKDDYELKIQHINFNPFAQFISLHQNTRKNIQLATNDYQLQEIVITAQESKGLVTSSKIDRQAMAHLQPSSFTDLLELLPGGKA